MDHNTHVYDKAKWHYDADDFPANLPVEHGFTHTAFFVNWLAEGELLSDFALEILEKSIIVQSREKTPIHLYELFDGCLIGDLLTEKGNRFSYQYYKKKYISDYIDIFEMVDNIYDVEPIWENYDKVKPVIDKRYHKWLQSSQKRKWKFWK